MVSVARPSSVRTNLFLRVELIIIILSITTTFADFYANSTRVPCASQSGFGRYPVDFARKEKKRKGKKREKRKKRRMSFPRSWKLDSQNIEFRWKRGFRWTRLLLNRGCEKSRNKEGDSFHPRLCSSFISHTRPSSHFFHRSKVPLRITQEIPRRSPILIDSLTPTRFNSAPRASPNEDVALSSSLCRYVVFFSFSYEVSSFRRFIPRHTLWEFR